MFVRCSDPNIICETKNMVLVVPWHCSVLCVMLLGVVCVGRDLPCAHRASLVTSPWW